jgi:hypothetical protein
MKKQLSNNIPTKIIDNFLEAPELWRYFALKQDFYSDETPMFPGQYSKPLNELNLNLFHSLASKLIQHLQGFTHFQRLETSFRIADESYGDGWIHHDDPEYNVAGLIYLNAIPAPNSGTILYTNTTETNKSYQDYKFQEFTSLPEQRFNFSKHKEEQRSFFKKNMTVHNVFNRCVLYSPLVWHSADKFFGNAKHNSRLTLNFFGRAV